MIMATLDLMKSYKTTPTSLRMLVENGTLIIEAQVEGGSAKRSKEVVEEFKGSNADVSILGNKEFTSARLVTRGKKEFAHARVKHVHALLRVAVPGQQYGCSVTRQKIYGLYVVKLILWNTLATIQTTFTRPSIPNTLIS